MNLIVTGISGGIGRILAAHWLTHGHQLIGISRHPKVTRGRIAQDVSVVNWDAITPEFFQIRKVDAVVNLSGSPMMQRWNKKTKPVILESRQYSLETIYSVVRKLPPSNRPKIIINASSVAIYSTQPRPVDESYKPDLDINFFQSLVWRKLEKRMHELSIPDVRTVIARIGLLIGPYRMMQVMLSWSRAGLGATLGNGRQTISWISHQDLARAFDHFLNCPHASGTYNVVSPEVASSCEFSNAIARTCGKRVRIRIPEHLLKLALGELADNFIVSAAIRPSALAADGFQWTMPHLFDAVDHARWAIQRYSRNPVLTHVTSGNH